MAIRSLTNEDVSTGKILYYPCMRHFDPNDDTRFRIIIIINVGGNKQSIILFLLSRYEINNPLNVLHSYICKKYIFEDCFEYSIFYV